ncbi:hypothetical protein [Streptomyces sp. NPDC005438]|uniref:hypothetical protein n=1 Tax=Streptomyces sp. NPDC005438 TaxID=3156880 RepID=UPI0033A19032
MRRRAGLISAPGAAAAVAAGVTALALGVSGCTGGSSEGSTGDTKPGEPKESSSAAPPGKYRTLPEPCGAVGAGTLEEMLPGTSVAPDGGGPSGASPSPYEGEATVTYDTDRRVGCRWQSETRLSTRHLKVSFERVVSYDKEVSDDERAEELFNEQASAARISLPKKDNATGDPADKQLPPKRPTPERTGADSSDDPDAQDPELAPRALTDVGDAAYLDDQLVTGDSGVHRDVTVVFRTANVLVTIEFDRWVTDKRNVPDSEPLQRHSRRLASQLAGSFQD